MTYYQKKYGKDFKNIKKYIDLKFQENLEMVKKYIDAKLEIYLFGGWATKGDKGNTGNTGIKGESGCKGDKGDFGYGLTHFADSSSKFCERCINILEPISKDSEDIDTVLLSKGMGALERTIPDGSIKGGDTRGVYAVDFQVFRLASSQVASGSVSFVGNGIGNHSDGFLSFNGNGQLNCVSGELSFIGNGILNNATGMISFIGNGESNNVSGEASFVGNGTFNVASSKYSFIGNGMGNTTPTTSMNPITIFGKFNKPGFIDETNERIFMIGNGIGMSDSDRRNIFSISNLGNIYFTGTANANSPNADFGEWFESCDGLPIPLHSTVVLLPNRKIKHCEKGEMPIGVVSNTIAFVANSAEEEWANKYERDDNGEIIYEDIEEIVKEPIYEEKHIPGFRKNIVVKKNGDSYVKITREPKTIKVPIYQEMPVYYDDILTNEISKEIKYKTIIRKTRKPKLNKKFNSQIKYIPRSSRKEWHVIGLLGVLKVGKDEELHPNWIKLENDLCYVK